MKQITWTDWGDGRFSVLIRERFPLFWCGTGDGKKGAVRAAMKDRDTFRKGVNHAL